MTSLIAFLIAAAFWVLVIHFVFRALDLIWYWYTLPLTIMDEAMRRYKDSQFMQPMD